MPAMSAQNRVSVLAFAASLVGCSPATSGLGSGGEQDEVGSEGGDTSEGTTTDSDSDTGSDTTTGTTTDTTDTTTGTDTDTATTDPTDTGSDTTTGEACGNGMLEDPEECDGQDYGGLSCESFGYAAGELGCDGACLIDTSACPAPPDGGSCQSDADCPSVLLSCVYNTCLNGSDGDLCLDDMDCKGAPHCAAGTCSPGLEGDSCDNDDGDCSAEAPACVYNTCHDGSAGDNCIDDMDCQDAPYCVFTCKQGLEGDQCINDGDCSAQAPHCVYSFCRDGSSGDQCIDADDCMTTCTLGTCD